MKLYGLIGYPLTHSFSAQYFNEKFYRENILDCSYELFPLQDISELKGLFKNYAHLKGLNISIPYKEQIIPFLSNIEETAKQIGAVNTVKIMDHPNFILHGFNTDVYGFEESIKPYLKKHHKKALILGTGGASKAVTFVLNKLGIASSLVSRNQSNTQNTNTYSEIDEETIHTHQIIINTTPIGMFPNISQMPEIPYQFLTKEHFLYDLIYNPKETLFLKEGRKKEATICNGEQMLYLQAEKSWQIWNKEEFAT